MNRKNIALLLLMSFVSSVGFARTNTPRIDQRQQNQERRIDQGVQSGQLTEKEQKNLEKDQANIEAKKDAAKADGVVTRQERRQIRHAENRESRKIYRLKHNNRVR